MKKTLSPFIICLCVFLMILGMTACGDEESAPAPESTSTSTTASDVEKDVTVIKTFSGIDENLGPYYPVNIEEIDITSDGSAILYPTDALKDSVGETFTVNGDIEDVYVWGYGNGGYRCVIFINNDGSLSILDPTELIDNNSIEKIDNIGGLSDIVKVTQTYSTDGVPTITAEDSSSHTYILDPYLN